MTSRPRSSTSVQLERLAGELHGLAFDYAEQSRSIQRADRLIADAERIAAEVRAAVRGR